MRFDDRLKTVLDTPVADERDRAVRWRQLIDLLSRAGGEADPTIAARALELVEQERLMVPDEVRAATARSIAGRPLDPRLIEFFAADILEVAAPLLAGVTMDAELRARVDAVASDEVRRFVMAIGGAAPAVEAPEPSSAPEPASVPSIGELVARIERVRSERPAPAPAAADLSAVAGDLSLFRWESDPGGSIAWVEGAPRAAMIGRALVGHRGEALLDEACRPVLSRRAPFVDLPLLPGEFPGEWKVSGAPAFSPGEGRFVGYRGIARRVDTPARPPERATRLPRQLESADSLRELVHEIKTPLNAIIGFAEIIDGQFLGPAHRSYRERAAGIVAQARVLLAAVEELDLVARIEAARGSQEIVPADLAQLLPPLVTTIDGAVEASLTFVSKVRTARCALAGEVYERLLHRLIGAVAHAAEPGEAMRIELAITKAMCTVAIARPTRLAGIDEAELLDPGFAADSDDGQLGVGFALRLVRGLVRIGGGDLMIEPGRFVVAFRKAS